jgi:predicted RNA binding protein YcfA (HicA-like mRNA interferase family)
MPRRKRVTGKQLIRALKRFGFDVVRVQGSHHRLRHADCRVTTVPVHAGETIGPGLPWEHKTGSIQCPLCVRPIAFLCGLQVKEAMWFSVGQLERS